MSYLGLMLKHIRLSIFGTSNIQYLYHINKMTLDTPKINRRICSFLRAAPIFSSANPARLRSKFNRCVAHPCRGGGLMVLTPDRAASAARAATLATHDHTRSHIPTHPTWNTVCPRTLLRRRQFRGELSAQK